MKSLKMAVMCAAIGVTGSAQAAFVFSDISVTTNSVTFTINGDMSGYSTSSTQSQFSIRYSDSIVSPALTMYTYFPNTWSSPVFDNLALQDSGNSGNWGNVYSWSEYQTSLSSAVATNRTVTVSAAGSWLQAGASGYIEFLWGNGNHSYATVLASHAVTVGETSPVPVPAAVWLLGSGLVGLAGFMRRKKA